MRAFIEGNAPEGITRGINNIDVHGVPGSCFDVKLKRPTRGAIPKDMSHGCAPEILVKSLFHVEMMMVALSSKQSQALTPFHWEVAAERLGAPCGLIKRYDVSS